MPGKKELKLRRGSQACLLCALHLYIILLLLTVDNMTIAIDAVSSTMIKVMKDQSCAGRAIHRKSTGVHLFVDVMNSQCNYKHHTSLCTRI